MYYHFGLHHIPVTSHRNVQEIDLMYKALFVAVP